MPKQKKSKTVKAAAVETPAEPAVETQAETVEAPKKTSAARRLVSGW